jgi:hypothetical protein
MVCYLEKPKNHGLQHTDQKETDGQQLPPEYFVFHVFTLTYFLEYTKLFLRFNTGRFCMIALRYALSLSRSGGCFGIPQGSAFTQRAIYTIFRRIYTEVNAPLGRSLQGRTSLNPSRSFSSGIHPSPNNRIPFPDYETLKDFIIEHPLLGKEFQKKRLIVDIATMCANRFSLRLMSDDNIAKMITQIYTDLSNGKDGLTGEEIQKHHLTNNMRVTLDKNLPLILKDCAKKYAITSYKIGTPHAAPIPDAFKLNTRMFHSWIGSASKSGLCTLAKTPPHFPDAETIKRFVANHEKLATPQFEKFKEYIATLCAHRFANRSMNTRGIVVAAERIAYDVANGKDGASGEEVQKLELSLDASQTLKRVLLAILQECSEKYGVDPDMHRVSGS